MHYNNTSLDDLEGEIWVDAVGFDGLYQVSNLGRIKSLGRMVNNGKGGRWVKERIRKQCASKDGRLTCPFSSEGINYSQNVSGIIFLSFNKDCEYDIRYQCVMHIDKNPANNILSNLKIETISQSHSVNFKKGLLSHLVQSNQQRTLDYLALTHKVCLVCHIKKEIKKFEYGRNSCMRCRYYYEKTRRNKIKQLP